MIIKTLSKRRFDALWASSEFIGAEESDRIALKVDYATMMALPGESFELKGNQTDHGRCNELFGWVLRHPDIVAETIDEVPEDSEQTVEQVRAWFIERVQHAQINQHTDEYKRSPSFEFFSVDENGKIIKQSGLQTHEGETKSKYRQRSKNKPETGAYGRRAPVDQMSDLMAENSSAI